ncbi:MAG: hypothetical protein WCP69_04205 [Bacteroidota bacterium]
METKIQKVLKQSFPDFFAQENIQDPNFETYQTLKIVFCQSVKQIEMGNLEKLKEVFEILDNLYQYGSLYEKNAIENEYLLALSTTENPISFGKHLKLMPKTLKSVFLKSIIEN